MLQLALLYFISIVTYAQIFIPLSYWQSNLGVLTISNSPTYNYGNTYRNTNIDKTFVVSNSTDSPVAGIKPSAFGTAVFNFKGGTYPGSGGTCGNSLQRGNTCTVIIAARSSSTGTFTDTLTLSYYSLTGLSSLSLGLSANFNAWVPTDLGANLMLWLDGLDTSTIRTGLAGVSEAVSGDAVSVWQDKSGNNYHAIQTTAARQPIYSSTNWAGGLPTLIFNSGLHGLISTGMTWQTYTIGLAIYHNDISLVRALLTKRGAVSTNFFWFIYDSTAGTVNWDQNGSRVNTSYVPTVSTNYIYTLVRPLTGTNRDQYVNGTLNYTSATNPNDSNTQDLIIGNDYSSTNRGAGSRFSEIVVASTNLSVSDRQKLEGYLAWKWTTVLSLPAGHPYKAAPP